MSILLEKIADEALCLSGEDRARLAEKLWDSLGDGEPLNPAWLAEIERRRAEVREGSVKPVPGEDVSRKAWELARNAGS